MPAGHAAMTHLQEKIPTLAEVDGGILILDQTRLPHEVVQRWLTTVDEVAQAIREMQVRGAPLIGATAAYGVALGLADESSDARLARAVELLATTRPTAVNLQWALTRMAAVVQKSALAGRREVAWREARAIAAEDVAANAAIGRHGLPLLIARKARRQAARAMTASSANDADQSSSTAIQIMTHCNAGRLATVAHGTALAPIYAAHAAGIAVHVWVSETRPRNQGLLTAWELAEAGVPHTLIADNAAGLLLMRGAVDLVIVGADRIAANGDTANKVGTYLKALAARAHGVPFYVAAPCTTLDYACSTGDDIPIEERAAAELGAGGAGATAVANPAFDITPAALIDGFISERGVAQAEELRQWQI
jgi:methylthioribose-1-phosphate isomerase